MSSWYKPFAPVSPPVWHFRSAGRHVALLPHGAESFRTMDGSAYARLVAASTEPSERAGATGWASRPKRGRDCGAIVGVDLVLARRGRTTMSSSR